MPSNNLFERNEPFLVKFSHSHPFFLALFSSYVFVTKKKNIFFFEAVKKKWNAKRLQEILETWTLPKW